MKTLLQKRGHSLRRGRAMAAFTLIEILFTSVITVLIVGAILSSYIYGLRMFQLTKPKLTSSDDARHTISKMIQEIRSAWRVSVGNGSATAFTPAAFDARQEGNAIQIFPVAGNTNLYSRYFRDPGDEVLKRISSSDPDPLELAHFITNSITFTAEDHLGATLTNSANSRVIALNLQFSQLRNPTVSIGPGKFFDYYQLRTKITRRAVL